MNPFIPLKEANLAIVAANAYKEIFDSLEALDIEVVPTIKCEDVYDSIAYHPDIVIHPINHKTLIIAPNVYDYYKEKLAKFNLKLIKGEKYLKSKYPDNIAYNVGRLSKWAIHNFKHTDRIVKDKLEKENIIQVHVNQGYSKCSMAIIGEDAIITGDEGIYNKLKELSYDVLLIEPGFIFLENQNYGFIGGTTGSYSKHEIFFSGNLDKHPSKNQILDFLQKNNKKPIYLSNKDLSDIGTIISLYCNK